MKGERHALTMPSLDQCKKLPVLVVDDEEVVRTTLSSILASEGYLTEAVEQAEDALQHVEQKDYLMVITDVMMPGMSGLEFQRYLRARRPELPVVVITGFPTIDLAVEALRDGAINFLTKPFDIREILRCVERSAVARLEVARFVATQQFIEDEIRASIPSTVEHVHGLIQFIARRSMLAESYPSHAAFQIRLALDEAMANALEHGNRFNREKRIHVHTRITSRRFEVTIEDEGEGFDPNRVADPVAEKNIEAMLEGGRGVFLMKCYMDGVEYNERGNQIRLWKDNPS